jgi:hypothetical protein
VVDWQNFAVGPPARDLAYCVGSSLDSGARAESDLLRPAIGVCSVMRVCSRYWTAECWDGYRVGMLQIPLLTIFGYDLPWR